MKRTIALCSIIAACLLAGCGKDKITNTYLPEKITDIANGGTIESSKKQGKENETEIKADYPLESLWGTWVPEEELGEQENHFDAPIPGEEGFESKISLTEFPNKMIFTAWWNEIDMGFGSDWSTLFSFTDTMKIGEGLGPEDMNDAGGVYEEEEHEDTLLGSVARKEGLGVGHIEYDYIQPKSSNGLISFGLGNYNTFYQIIGDTLAVGLSSCNDMNQENDVFIQEIDYKIDYTGYKITLTHDDQSVTYIPEYLAQNREAGDTKIVPNDSVFSVEEGYEELFGLHAIQYRGEISVLPGIHSEYEAVDCDFKEDGTVRISGERDTIYDGKYLMSETGLTLYSEDTPSVYSIYRRPDKSYNVGEFNDRTTNLYFIGVGGSTGPLLEILGEKVYFYPEMSMQDFFDHGFTSEYDLTVPQMPGVVTEEMDFQASENDVFVLKAVNPYEKAAPLSECKICYVRVDQAESMIKTPNGSQIGKTTYDVVEHYYKAPYEQTENMLRYKTHGSCLNLDIQSSLDKMHAYGDTILDVKDNEMEVVYNFANGVISSIEFIAPKTLYNGLQDNVSNSFLENMSQEAVSATMDKRDSILEKLEQEFDKKGIRVNIDSRTGEIVMDSNILFGYDSYELSKKGKDYIDGFMGVYASVILDPVYENDIEKICFEGHTDSKGSYEYNLKLSQNRSDAVLNYCLNQSNNVSSEQKTKLKAIAESKGYSFTNPIYDKEGNEDMDASRRVAIKFYVTVE